MFLNPKRFFDADPPTGGGAPGSEGQPGGGAAPAAEPLLTEDEFKNYGFDSKEQMKEYLAHFGDSKLTPEQVKQREQSEKADFIKFSADENMMSTDEIIAYDTLKAKKDADLVFENFLKDWKTENPDVSENIEQKAREAFNSEYGLDSTNDKTKSRGEAKLAREAKEIRQPLESRYTSAKEKYDERTMLRKEVPNFNTTLSSIVSKLTPDKLSLYSTKEGDKDITGEVEIKKEDRDAIIKEFSNSKTFHLYMKDKKTFEQAITKKISSFLKVQYFDTAVKDAFKKGKDVGTASSPKVGAENPFGFAKDKQRQAPPKDETLEQSNERMARARERAR